MEGRRGRDDRARASIVGERSDAPVKGPTGGGERGERDRRRVGGRAKDQTSGWVIVEEAREGRGNGELDLHRNFDRLATSASHIPTFSRS